MRFRAFRLFVCSYNETLAIAHKVYVCAPSPHHTDTLLLRIRSARVLDFDDLHLRSPIHPPYEVEFHSGFSRGSRSRPTTTRTETRGRTPPVIITRIHHPPFHRQSFQVSRKERACTWCTSSAIFAEHHDSCPIPCKSTKSRARQVPCGPFACLSAEATWSLTLVCQRALYSNLGGTELAASTVPAGDIGDRAATNGAFVDTRRAEPIVVIVILQVALSIGLDVTRSSFA